MTDPIDINDFTKVTKAVIDRATDARTVAIMAASYIDDYLGRAIRTKLAGVNATLSDKLFGAYGPLSTMAAKIDFARALNLTTSAMRDDLIIINRVRNRFAHNIHVDSFSHPDVLKLCSKFRRDHEHFPEEARAAPLINPSPDPRGVFGWQATMHGMFLHNLLAKAGTPVLKFTPRAGAPSPEKL